MAEDIYTDPSDDRERRRDTAPAEADDQTRTTAVAASGEAPKEEKPGLFDGLSIAQIIAAAAAGATSMALSSTIGFGGSIINAAVSSVVTVVCSQVYRRALDASAEKVKEGISSRGGSRKGSDAATTTALDSKGVSEATQTRVIADETTQGTRVASEELRENASEREAGKRSSTQKKVIIFSVILAVIAVVVCAAIILLGTGGEGIGEKTEGIDLTEVIEVTADTEDEDEDDAAAASMDEDEDEGAESTGTSSSSRDASSSATNTEDEDEDSSTDASANTGAGSSTGTETETETEDAGAEAETESGGTDADASAESGSTDDAATGTESKTE